MVILSRNICDCYTFNRNRRYFIDGEIRVEKGVTVTIENGVVIYLINGPQRSSLIFETGSQMLAEKFKVKACNINLKEEKLANNGGIWFLGSSSIAEKDGVDMTFSPSGSFFKAKRVETYYLGRSDPRGGDGPNTDDIDAVSVLGVNNNEWKIVEIWSFFSGDDGFDLENSSITLRSLRVERPKGDGVNITSSRVNILDRLVVKMVKSPERDRDLFDLEVDDGPSFLRLAKGCRVKIEGFFGDELNLVSDDLPQPDDGYYIFNGFSAQGQTYIYSFKKD